MVETSPESKIRLLAITEGGSVTGPAKNLLEFCRVSKSLDAHPAVATSIATFVRGGTNEGEPSNDLLEAAHAAGVEVHCIPERFPFDPQVIGGLRKLVRRLKPDIIQTHHVKSHFLVRLSGVWRTCPWVAFHHGYTKDAKRTLVYNQLDRWALRAPTQIVTVCQPFKQQIADLGIPSSRVSVLHNAISLDWLNGREDLAVNSAGAVKEISNSGDRQEQVVLAVGRLSEEKAFADLVVAMDQLRRLRPDRLVRLLIVGDGPERGRIQQAIEDYSLQDRVTLAGYVRDVRPYYRRAAVLAISSISEGSPNALLEAMAAGVPVVATSVGGIPEIVIDRDTALVVGPRDPGAMASAINLLLANRNLAESLAARARDAIQERYSPQSRAKFLIGFYQEICRGKN